MIDKNKLVQTTLSGLVAFGSGLGARQALAVPDQPQAWEKSAAIAKAGNNNNYAALTDGNMVLDDAEKIRIIAVVFNANSPYVQ